MNLMTLFSVGSGDLSHAGGLLLSTGYIILLKSLWTWQSEAALLQFHAPFGYFLSYLR
jgi:hypothetical protein